MVNSILYGIVHNNKVVTIYAKFPERIRLADGFTRTSLEKYSKKELLELGLYTLYDRQPDYDPETEYLYLKGYKILTDRIVSQYEVHKR